MASCTCARAPAMSFEAALPGREYCGRPPTTSTTQGAPSALASSIGAAVVVARLDPMRGIGHEHAAAAIARQFEPGIAHRPHRAIEADGRDLVAPGIDGADAMPRAGLDDGDEIALLADGRGVQRQPAMVGRKIPHHGSTPRVASTVFMRRVASSGLASSPALSASRNSSARCSVERVLSCPPTMVK